MIIRIRRQSPRHLLARRTKRQKEKGEKKKKRLKLDLSKRLNTRIVRFFRKREPRK